MPCTLPAPRHCPPRCTILTQSSPPTASAHVAPPTPTRLAAHTYTASLPGSKPFTKTPANSLKKLPFHPPRTSPHPLRRAPLHLHTSRAGWRIPTPPILQNHHKTLQIPLFQPKPAVSPPPHTKAPTKPPTAFAVAVANSPWQRPSSVALIPPPPHAWRRCP